VSRAGITLVELLVALTIGALVLTLAGATAAATRRLAAVVDQRSLEGQRTTAVPALVGAAVGRAGRGIDGCGLRLAEGGRRVTLLGVDSGDTAPSTVELFAGLDGGGRSALYLRTLPHARQPWLEGVTGFTVIAGRDAAGVWRDLVDGAAARWTGLRVTLAWGDGDVRLFDLALPHAPCLEPGP